MRQRNAMLKACGIRYYQPHAKQAAFHASPCRYRMVKAGNRFGKSEMGCAEDIAWLLGERMWLPENDPVRRQAIPQRPVKGVIATTDWDVVDKVWTSDRSTPGGKLWRLLPQDSFDKPRRNQQGVIDCVPMKNGSILYFKTVKQWKNDPQSCESSDYDFAHFDEPVPEKMYTALTRGLIDRRGFLWFTLTPLREPWISDLFFPDNFGAQVLEDSFAVSGSIYDNPYIPPSAIKEFENSLNEDEKQCRLHGIDLHLAGTIYKAYDRTLHVMQKVPPGWKSFAEPPLTYPVYVTIDVHPQTPHCALFCTVDPAGRRYYFKDIFRQCSIDALSSAIKEVVGSRRLIACRVDPLAYINDPITESNMAEEFWKNGLYVEKATKALAQGILRVQREFEKRPPALYITPEARRLQWELPRYCWDERENKPIDKDDHAVECLYRMELMEPCWVSPVATSGPVPEMTIPMTADIVNDQIMEVSYAI